MTEEQPQYRLLAGVFVDELTGQPTISTGSPEIDPIAIFARAIENLRIMELQHKTKKGPEILIPGGPLPGM